MLGVVLQQCAVQARTPPDTFCGSVQEVNRCLALVMEEVDWINMEKEISEGVMKDPVVAAAPRVPMPKRVPSQTPKVEKPMVSISLEPPSASEPDGVATPQDLGLVPRRQPPPPPYFLPRSWRTLPHHPLQMPICWEAQPCLITPPWNHWR